MSGEGPRDPNGLPRVDEREGLIIVEVVEEEDALIEPVESSLDDAPVTVGEIVDGAKDILDGFGSGVRRMVDRGRYRKVRVTRKGKPVIPDIPLAAVAALEVASLYGAGLARVLAVNVGARFLFDVEVINEADKYFKAGTEAFLDGDLERTEQALLKAVRIDDSHAGAYLQLGVLYRLQGETAKARSVLARAHKLDDAGDIGKKAQDILRALDAKK